MENQVELIKDGIIRELLAELIQKNRIVIQGVRFQVLTLENGNVDFVHVDSNHFLNDSLTINHFLSEMTLNYQRLELERFAPLRREIIRELKGTVTYSSLFKELDKTHKETK